MANKVLCPWHKEDTPSLEIYPNGSVYCFGCNRFASGVVPPSEITPVFVEDLNAKIELISQLPQKVIRGVFLPYDDVSYYIVWPGLNYYKRRFNEDGSGSKYKCPSGHKKPLFWAAQFQNAKTVFIVEGEMNALSLSQVVPDNVDVCSPGSAGDLYSSQYKETLLNIATEYENIVLIADNDEPGAKGIIELMGRLLQVNKRLSYFLMDEDANDILVKHGEDTLRTKTMEMLGRVSGYNHPLLASGEASSEAEPTECESDERGGRRPVVGLHNTHVSSGGGY